MVELLVLFGFGVLRPCEVFALILLLEGLWTAVEPPHEVRTFLSAGQQLGNQATEACPLSHFGGCILFRAGCSRVATASIALGDQFETAQTGGLL